MRQWLQNGLLHADDSDHSNSNFYPVYNSHNMLRGSLETVCAYEFIAWISDQTQFNIILLMARSVDSEYYGYPTH